MSESLGEHDNVEQKLHEATLDVHEAVFAIRELAETIKGQSNRQTVVVETKGLSAVGAAGLTACIFTFLGLILLAIILIPEVHDLRAWNDTIRAKIARIEAQHTGERKP